jgi:hypothetical protein
MNWRASTALANVGFRPQHMGLALTLDEFEKWAAFGGVAAESNERIPAPLDATNPQCVSFGMDWLAQLVFPHIVAVVDSETERVGRTALVPHNAAVVDTD